MVIIIESVWCLSCGNQFYAVDDNNGKYKCPNCNKELNFHEETCRYIVDK